MWILYIVLFLLILGWAQSEFKQREASQGLASLLLGCLLFSFGLILADSGNNVMPWVIVGMGVCIALYGVARVFARQTR